MEELKVVSSDDIQRVARKYIKPDQVQILVVGNALEIGNQLDKYGTVNTIDITIPQPISKEEKISGDAEAGKTWLTRMAEAIISNGTKASSISSKSIVTQITPMGSMNIQNESTINYDEISMVADLLTPQGKMTMELQNGTGILKMMGQEQPLHQ